MTTTTTEAALRDALEKARDQFRLYETLHAAKGSLDGDAKARTNCEFAEMCDRALSQPSPASSTAGEDDYKRGIYAAKCWLRDQQHKNPPDSLWHAAAILADRMDVALLSPSSGEPASVAVEADDAEALAAKLTDEQKACVLSATYMVSGKWRVHCRFAGEVMASLWPLGVLKHEGSYLTPLGEKVRNAIAAALSMPTPVEAGLREALDLLKRWKDWSCGQVGLSPFHETRSFLAALSETQPPRETSTHTGERGE